MQKNTDAFLKAERLVNTILKNILNISKPKRKFFLHISLLWLGIKGRYNFLNLSRQGTHDEKTYRNQFEKKFPWLAYNASFIEKVGSGNHVAAFDPSFIPKSGKLTPHKSYFWSGKDQRALKGLEIGCLAMVDVDYHTAFHLEALQTPTPIELKAKGKTMVGHYTDYILQCAPTLSKHVKYLTVDSYFAKKEFITPILLVTELHVITKLRKDANLRYYFSGSQSEGRGRKKKFAGKVDLKNPDKRKLKRVFEDDETEMFSGVVHCQFLNHAIRLVLLCYKEKNNFEVFMSTDLEQDAQEIVRFYRLRYQIEFLLRDAKQSAGLEECQARNENSLDYHFNMALTSVNLSKAITLLEENNPAEAVFSMANVKTWFSNRIITDFIFSNLEIDLSCKKIKSLFQKCLDFGRIAA